MDKVRYIYKDEFDGLHTIDKRVNGKFIGDKAVQEKLYEYEQEESEGKLIHLPFPVGSTVYVSPTDKIFYPAKLYGMDENGTYLVLVKIDRELKAYDWFRKVYSKEEAQLLGGTIKYSDCK